MFGIGGNMEVEKIVNFVANLLKITELASESIFEDLTLLSAQTQSDLNLIVNCINLTASEIATDYLPIVFEEDIVVLNNQFDLKNLSKTILKPMELKFGLQNAFYKVIDNKLITKCGNYTLKYSIMPDTFELDDDIICFSSALSLAVFCYGVCANYTLIGGSYEESSLWESKFKDGILVAGRKNKEIKMPQRRWY